MYAVNIKSANLFIEPFQNESKYKIFKRELAYDQQDYLSLIDDTMFRGRHWDVLLRWYLNNDIENYMNTNEAEYGEIIYYEYASSICYQGLGNCYCPDTFKDNNEKDVEMMIKDYFKALKQHFDIDWIAVNILKFKLECAEGDLSSKYSFFITQNTFYSDCYDLFVKRGKISFCDATL